MQCKTLVHLQAKWRQDVRLSFGECSLCLPLMQLCRQSITLSPMRPSAGTALRTN